MLLKYKQNQTYLMPKYQIFNVHNVAVKNLLGMFVARAQAVSKGPKQFLISSR